MTAIEFLNMEKTKLERKQMFCLDEYGIVRTSLRIEYQKLSKEINVINKSLDRLLNRTEED